jgi:hypothetical protein
MTNMASAPCCNCIVYGLPSYVRRITSGALELAATEVGCHSCRVSVYVQSVPSG